MAFSIFLEFHLDLPYALHIEERGSRRLFREQRFVQVPDVADGERPGLFAGISAVLDPDLSVIGRDAGVVEIDSLVGDFADRVDQLRVAGPEAIPGSDFDRADPRAF